MQPPPRESARPLPHPTGPPRNGRATAEGDGEAGGPADPIGPALRQFAESLSDLVWSARPDGGTDFHNRHFLDYVGRAADEVKGWAWTEAVHPDDAEGARRAWERAVASGGEYDVEFRLRRNDGAFRWHRSHGSPMRDADGGVTRWFGTCTDIDDRRRAEAERERFFAVGADMLVVAGTDGHFKRVSPSCERTLGWTPEEMTARPWVEFVHPDDRGTADDLERHVAAGQEVLSCRNRYRHKDGSYRWLEWKARAYPEEGLIYSGAVDVTERVRTEEALRENEERFRALMEQAPFCVHVYSPEGRIVRVNPAWEALWGITLDMVRDFNIFTDPQVEARGILPLIQRVFAGEAVRFPTHRYDPDETLPGRSRNEESVRWIESIGYPLKDAEGRVREVVIIHEDVTARHRAEAALREGEATLRAFFDNTPTLAGVVEPTESGDILHVDDSPVTCRFFGAPPGSTAGRLASELGARPEVLAQWLDAYRRADAAGGPERFEYEHPRPGGPRWLSVTVSPIGPGPSGRRRFCYVAEDVTQRRRADEALRLSEQRWRTMAEALPNLLWTDLPDGQCDWLSSQWGRYTGIPEQELLGLRWVETVLHPDDRERTLACWQAACEDRGDYDLEYRIRRHDGQYRWFKTRGVPVRDESGRIVYWFGTCTDIEDVKRMEAALQDADRRKDEFLATLAHELRNPLAPIRNALHLMHRPGLDPELEADRAMAERQVAHLARLVDDLMDVARISRGKIDLRKEAVDLRAVVRQAVETARPLIGDRRHRLSVALPEGPIWLDADPTRLEQVLWNLLNNAAKYTPPGGAIALEVEPARAEAVIRVRDDGMGIDPAVLPHLFQMFVQVGEHREHAQGGLGIGLGLVRSLVEMHGGSIDAHSDGPGTGSAFVVRLPMSSAPSPAGPGAERRAGPWPRRRVLVVDDNVDAARSLARLLDRRYGQEVRVAHDGQAALDAAEAFRPEVVILDLGMPGLDGYEVARRLRARPGAEALTIVALTGWGQEADRRRSREAGFDRHLVKPIGTPELEDLLGDLRR